ncbi:MAG: OOP family OmpA-OmpF porin [Maribacter sp.]|jgi:OOP family OmpA-OmpF porin
MTKRIYALLVLLFCVTFAFAQSSLDIPSYEGSTGFQDDEKSESADNYFPPKPKHGTEIGLNFGTQFIAGDVSAGAGWGVGLHVRRAFNYTLSWRLQGVFGYTTGLDQRLSSISNSGIQIHQGSWRNKGYQPNARIYRNYKTRLASTSAHLVVNLSNILFHKKSNKWNVSVFAGPTLLGYEGKTNILNGEGAYTRADGSLGMQTVPGTTGDGGLFSNLSRDKINSIKDILDDSYETEFVYEDNRDPHPSNFRDPKGGKNINLLNKEGIALIPGLDIGFGVSRKINDKINIGLEYQFMFSLNDDIDGHDKVNSNIDVPQYVNFKINYNFNPKEGVEPLYWVNPLVNPTERIAKLERDKVELKDTDGDGVLDNFDEEPDTPADTPVDTKGRTLDSDGDGVSDADDVEPYTPYDQIGNVDSKGKSPAPEVCESCLTKEDILAIGKEAKWDEKGVTTIVDGGCSDWFLPMIHFDLNKSALKSESKAQLHHIAQVMKQCPEICIVAVGHTDRLNDNAYNQTLSYKRAKASVDYLIQVYGISPSRLKVNYGGEETPIVDTNTSSYINRRVEFKVCNGEMDMGAPGNGGDTSPSGGFGTSGSAPVKY